MNSEDAIKAYKAVVRSGAIHLDRGEVTFSITAGSGNISEMMYGAEKSEVGNGGLSSIPSDRRPAVA